MKRKQFIITLITASFFLFYSGVINCSVPALAEQTLSAEEIRNLIFGNTVEAHSNIDMVGFKAFFRKNGTAVSVNDRGNLSEGSWRINEAGEHCMKWENKEETCASIIAVGDGTYKSIEKGEVRSIWKKVLSGDAL